MGWDPIFTPQNFVFILVMFLKYARDLPVVGASSARHVAELCPGRPRFFLNTSCVCFVPCVLLEPDICFAYTTLYQNHNEVTRFRFPGKMAHKVFDGKETLGDASFARRAAGMALQNKHRLRRCLRLLDIRPTVSAF